MRIQIITLQAFEMRSKRHFRQTSHPKFKKGGTCNSLPQSVAQSWKPKWNKYVSMLRFHSLSIYHNKSLKFVKVFRFGIKLFYTLFWINEVFLMEGKLWMLKQLFLWHSCSSQLAMICQECREYFSANRKRHSCEEQTFHLVTVSSHWCDRNVFPISIFFPILV